MTTNICRVCGEPFHPQRGQRIAAHTLEMHYEEPTGLSRKRAKELREEFLSRLEDKHPDVFKRIGKRAKLTIRRGGPLAADGSSLGPVFRTARGTFDFNGQTFQFKENDGAIWEIDADSVYRRLTSLLSFEDAN